jgi:DNA topoisomerase-1
MRVAQELYEGIDVDGIGPTGLITYMRTDSLRISTDAMNEAASYIKSTFGEVYLPAKPRVFKSRSNAQDGHEAIRPTSVMLTPDRVKANLTTDQYKLYNLIHSRFVASQMEDAKIKTTTVFINAKDYELRTFSSNYEFKGLFLLLFYKSSYLMTLL